MPRNLSHAKVWTPKVTRVDETFGSEFATNIRLTLANETPMDRADGTLWYGRALGLCVELARYYGRPLSQIVDAIAIASPRKEWGYNRAAVVWALENGAAPDKLNATGGIVLTGNNADKLHAVLFEDRDLALEQVMGASAIDGKVENFRDSIATAGRSDRVCIDKHMIRAMYNGKIPACHEEFIFQTQWAYDLTAKVVADLAHEIHEYPATLQARLWVVSKRTTDHKKWPLT